MRNARRRVRGTTLIEAMIAMVVLAVGVAGVASAMIATAGQDRRNNARSNAVTVANDLALTLSRLHWNDPRVAPAVYLGTAFSAPRVTGATQVPGAPPTVTDTWTAGQVPTYGEANFPPPPPLPPPPPPAVSWPPLGQRTQAELNTSYPGKLLLMNRYWNVMLDPTNPNLKLIAVHVTYYSGKRQRGVATVFTSVLNEQALANAFSF